MFSSLLVFIYQCLAVSSSNWFHFIYNIHWYTILHLLFYIYFGITIIYNLHVKILHGNDVEWTIKYSWTLRRKIWVKYWKNNHQKCKYNICSGWQKCKIFHCKWHHKGVQEILRGLHPKSKLITFCALFYFF